ncbi:P-loop containing nucleoside triphosphate hydrolase protein [Aspergillus minisclerotigenes]|uniref:Elongation factor 1-alpha n=1 Tax=Aspergillus minisclerotigenes TaxID=656917 RepID=A0A5N6JHJ5_9EURO|nr:P-loop containing nucleoside triphosphate hydrolase protein [Aspergillus minisclerotigenes]
MHDLTRGALTSIGINVEINTPRAFALEISPLLQSSIFYPEVSIHSYTSVFIYSWLSFLLLHLYRLCYSTYLITSILKNLFVSFRELQEPIFNRQDAVSQPLNLYFTSSVAKPFPACNREKPHITAVLLGHLDHGKSTTAVQSMLSLSSDLLCAGARPHDNHSPQEAGPSYKYGWVIEKLRAERKRGITIDISLCTFETSKYVVTVIDAPGHRDYIKNTITGASQADCAILVTSATNGEFEAGVDQGGQSLAVNKMDTPRYTDDRFDEIIKETSRFIKKIGYNPKAVAFVPISGLYGDNLVEESPNMSWFKGWTSETKYGVLKGKTLLDAIDAVEPLSHRNATDKPLRLPIRDVKEVPDIGTVLVGRIETGTITPGMELTIAPTNITAEVVSIERNDEELHAGHAGEHVSVHIAEVEEEIRPGYVAGDPNNDPPASVASFNAQVVILSHSGEISPGYTATVDCLTAHVPCRLSRILHKKDRRTGRPTEQSPESIRVGDCAVVEMVPTKPMCVEPYSKNPCLGRFIIREGSCTFGTVEDESDEYDEDDEGDESDEYDHENYSD